MASVQPAEPTISETAERRLTGALFVRRLGATLATSWRGLAPCSSADVKAEVSDLAGAAVIEDPTDAQAWRLFFFLLATSRLRARKTAWPRSDAWESRDGARNPESI
jgi:hypothetical protein